MRNALKHRIPWVDVAKGTAIILMVLGHSSLPNTLHQWIFAFHMPLFFILSGFTSNWYMTGGGDDILLFTFRKFIMLGRPFIFYSLICLGIIYCFNLASLSWWRGWGDFALWFVPVLFVALVIARLVLLATGWIKWLFVLLLPIISGLFRYYGIYLPWNMSVAPFAAFFIILGREAKGHHDFFINSKWWYIAFAFILTLAISHFWHLDMARNQCLPLIPLAVGAFAGTAFTCSVSQVIDHHSKWLSKVLQTVGRETFVILAFSQVIIMTINKYFNLNAVLKYCILIMTLVAITYIKRILVNHYHLLINNDR